MGSPGIEYDLKLIHAYCVLCVYCVTVNPDFNWFSLQQWVFDTSLQKIAHIIPNAVVKQSAKVLGPLVIYLFIYLYKLDL